MSAIGRLPATIIQPKEQNVMNNIETNEDNNQSVIIEDLNTKNDEEIKGGPIYMKIEGVEGSVTSANTTSGPMPQTREHILLAKQ